MSHSASITTDPGSVAGILADVARRGITLQPHAGKVRFRPRSAMTPDLAQRIKARRTALLALLSDTTPPDVTAISPDGGESRVSSVVSVSEPPKWPTVGRGLWSQDELVMLARAGTTPADLPIVSAVKDAFADVGASVVAVKAAHGRGGWARHEIRDGVAELIRHARRCQAGEAVTMRDAWRERLAICTIDGGLAEDDAKRIALAELEETTLLSGKR